MSNFNWTETKFFTRCHSRRQPRFASRPIWERTHDRTGIWSKRNRNVGGVARGMSRYDATRCGAVRSRRYSTTGAEEASSTSSWNRERGRVPTRPPTGPALVATAYNAVRTRAEIDEKNRDAGESEPWPAREWLMDRCHCRLCMQTRVRDARGLQRTYACGHVR